MVLMLYDNNDFYFFRRKLLKTTKICIIPVKHLNTSRTVGQTVVNKNKKCRPSFNKSM